MFLHLLSVLPATENRDVKDLNFLNLKVVKKTVYVEMFCSGTVDKYNIYFEYFNQILGLKSWHNLVQSYDL